MLLSLAHFFATSFRLVASLNRLLQAALSISFLTCLLRLRHPQLTYTSKQ